MSIADRWISDELGILVQGRTAELERANQMLRTEIIELKRAEEYNIKFTRILRKNRGVAGAI